ncbi:DUF2934 domain-containing protein [Kaarinaea lacus]
MAEKSATKATASPKKTAKKKSVTKKSTTKKKASVKSSAAKEPGKKTTSKTEVKTDKKTAKIPGAKKAKLAGKSSPATDPKRFALIQQTAYYIAEKRGFVGGDPEKDWLMAEKQVDEMLKQSST